LSKDELGAAAKLALFTIKKTVATNNMAILKRLAIMVFLQNGF
jgi:hypothetical protein